MAGQLTTATIDSGAASTAPVFKANGTEIGQLCKAWVNFNGVTTVSIRSSFNVSSVTRNSAGNYTLNFTNAMTDANYIVTGSAAVSASANTGLFTIASAASNGAATLYTTTQVTIQIMDVYSANSAKDSAYIMAAVFR